jgi:hypothetical protein
VVDECLPSQKNQTKACSAGEKPIGCTACLQTACTLAPNPTHHNITHNAAATVHNCVPMFMHDHGALVAKLLPKYCRLLYAPFSRLVCVDHTADVATIERHAMELRSLLAPSSAYTGIPTETSNSCQGLRFPEAASGTCLNPKQHVT